MDRWTGQKTWVSRRKRGGQEGGRTEREAGGTQASVVSSVLFLFLLGSTVTAEIQGVIDACVKLTGMPDLTLSFMVLSTAGVNFLWHGR